MWLPKETVHLLRVSHLRFGREEAFRRSCRALLRDYEVSNARGSARGAAGTAAVTRRAHPCLTVGDEVTLEMRLSSAASSGSDKQEWTFYGEVCAQ